MTTTRISALLAAAGMAISASAVTAIWTGNGDGVSWEDPANWSTGIVPTLVDDVIIDQLPANSAVVLNSNRTVSTLTVNGGDSLEVTQSGDLTITGGQVTNDGEIRFQALNGSAANVLLQFNGNSTIQGTGSLILSDDINNIVTSTNAVLTNDAGHTIRGAGTLLLNSGGMTNRGAIIADGTNTALTINPGAGFFFTNDGQMVAAGAAGMTLGDGFYMNNTAMEVLNGSVLTVTSGATIQGGELITSGTGFVDARNGSAYQGVTLTAGSRAAQAQSQNTTITSGLTNNGRWELNAVNGSAAATVMAFSGSQTISGNGEIVLSDDANNIISTTNATLTNSAGHTIRGAGIVINNSGGMVNDGAVLQQGVVALTVNPGAGFTFLNNGVLRAEGAGGMVLGDGAFVNNTAIVALDGSSVTASSGTTIVGGDLTSVGSGFFDMLNGAILDGVRLTAGTAVQQRQSQNIQIFNGIENNGTWVIDSVLGSGAATTAAFSGSQTLSGNGEVVLSNDTNNIITTTNATLTHGADHTIRGAGVVVNNSGGLTNLGTIIQQGDRSMTLNPGAGFAFTNLGTLRAEGSGGLVFADGLYEFGGTAIDIAAGSSAQVNGGALLRDAVINAAPGAAVDLRSGAQVDAVTVSAGSLVTQDQSQNVQSVNGITNNGRWEVNASPGSGAATTLAFNGSQTLSGTGEVVFSDDANNIISTTNAVLTHAAGHTIRGAGILINNSGGVINNGSVVQQGLRSLFINPGAGFSFTNNNVLRAEGPGGIVLGDGAHVNNATIEALDGSILVVNSGANVLGGTLKTNGAAVVSALSGSTFTGVTIDAGSTVLQSQSQNVTITNSITNNGTWQVDSSSGSGASTTLTFTGANLIGGSGQLLLNDDPNNLVTSTNAVLTNGENHTIRGSGTLISNSGGFTNLGTVLATGSSHALRIDIGAGFVLQNLGTFGGTGTFDIVDGTFSNDGTIAAGLSIGELTIDGDVVNTATATLEVELGAAGLSDVLTVTGDYEAGGTLDVSSLAGFVPDTGLVYEVVSAASVTGNFSNAVADVSGIAFGVTSNGLTFDVQYTSDSILILNAVPAPGVVTLMGLAGLAATRRRR